MITSRITRVMPDPAEEESTINLFELNVRATDSSAATTHLVHLTFGHVVVASGDHAGDLHVDIDHDQHRDEEGAHCGIDDVRLVLIVMAVLRVATLR